MEPSIHLTVYRSEVISLALTIQVISAGFLDIGESLRLMILNFVSSYWGMALFKSPLFESLFTEAFTETTLFGIDWRLSRSRRARWASTMLGYLDRLFLGLPGRRLVGIVVGGMSDVRTGKSAGQVSS